MRNRNFVRLWATVASAALVAVTLVVAPITSEQPAVAVSGSQFDPSYIISDAYFYDGNAMSESAIAAFLQANIGACTNGLCLNVVRTNTTSRAADAMCNAYVGAAAETAAAIIFKVQQSCGISAKVLLVNLQKEQSLVTHTSPSASRLDRAMGYACPDNTAQPGWCDPAFGGLYNQIYRAAWQFKRYANPPGTSNFFNWYPVGSVSNVLYHPNSACGSSPVRIANKATAALYYYTPYQPNAAALGNLYGVGDGCSAYGNRNFWRMYNDWFGATTLPAGTPDGSLDSVTSGVGSLTLSGWAVDPDAVTESVNVSIQVDSQWFLLVADKSGDNMSSRYPGAGNKHAFSGTIQVPPGAKTVCIYLGNRNAGTTGSLGCRVVTVLDTSPRGEIRDVWTSLDGISLWGWAADEDQPTTPLTVRISVAGKNYNWTANQEWAPIADLMPGVGTNHGWGSTVSVPGGSYTVCVTALNVGGGKDSSLGCRDVVVPDGSPKGEIKKIWATTAGISMWGWAVDPDSLDTPSTISIQAGGRWFAWKADQEYLPAKDSVPGAGDNHGWGGTVELPAGTHNACVYVGNRNRGSDVSLGCQTVSVPDGSPKGQLVSAWGSSAGVSLWGWAMDADVPGESIKLSVQVDSNWYVWDANQPYAPAQQYMSGAGLNHGYGGTIPASAGPHTVCVYPINVGAGNAVSFGCRTVVVPDASPVGAVQGVWTTPAGISMWGWAIDPDALTSPVPLAIQVDSSWYTWAADQPYLPAQSYVSGAGPNHGWGSTAPAAPGRHTVCVYAVNQNQGSNKSFGCYVVTVPSG